MNPRSLIPRVSDNIRTALVSPRRAARDPERGAACSGAMALRICAFRLRICPTLARGDI